jgi:hypothetical protein
VLSDRVRILSGLHDCDRWLARIRDAGRDDALLPDDDAERTSYLLHLGRSVPEAWRIDEGLEAILGVFAEPQRCDAVAAMLREATGDDGVDEAFFRELVGAGILVPAPETTAGAMH